MSDYDRYLAAHSKYPARVTCMCGEEWDDVYEEEYGAGSLTVHEECPKCGAGGEDLSVDPMDQQDIEERKAEARGDDF